MTSVERWRELADFADDEAATFSGPIVAIRYREAAERIEALEAALRSVVLVTGHLRGCAGERGCAIARKALGVSE